MEKPPENGADEIGWTWKRKPLQGYGHAISLFYQRKILSDIKSVLTDVGGEKLLQQFMDSCFGHLLRFIGGTSCNQALHELISREITLAGARDDELWFRIGETNIRFAPAEYALVTGLCFGSSTFDLLESHEMPPEGLFNQLCCGHPISIRELWHLFKQGRLGISPEDYLKVAHVLALNMMALGRNPLKRVEEWMWALVDDLDAWNGFPWGAYTYKALLHCVSILPRKRARVRRYCFSGPVWALQIWAYEAIPRLGKASALIARKVTVPRCLNWSFPRWNRTFPKHIFEWKLDCCVKLEPTDKEKRQPYWLSVQTEQPLGVPYVYGHSRKQGRRGAVSRRGVATAASLSMPRARRSSIRTPIVESSLGEPESPVEAPDTDDSVLNVQFPELLDDAQFHQLSSWLVDRLIEPMVKKLIPHVNQKIEDLFQAREVDNQFATRNPGYNPDYAKADEKKEQSFDGGSSSMHILRHEKVDEDDFGSEEECKVPMNDPRLDTRVANRGDSAIPNEESRSKRDRPIPVWDQRDSTKKAGIKPPRAGEADGPELLANPCSSKVKKKKKSSSRSKCRRWSPSSNEESSGDEGSESSSFKERLAGPSSNKAKKKKLSSTSKHRKRSPSSDEETNDDERNESSFGDERLEDPSSSKTKKKKKSSSRSKRRRSSPLDEERSDEGNESSSGDERLADTSSSKVKKKKKNKSSSRSKRKRQSPSSNEESSDDERSESSSGDERRRKMKKRGKKKTRNLSESSSSESSDSDRHQTKKKKLKRHRARSSRV